MDDTQNILSNYDVLLNQYDLYIWDFDMTILRIHSYANNMDSSEVNSMNWKKFVAHFWDPIFFRDLVNYIISKKKKVAICSFATYNVIKAFMDRLFDNDKIFGLHNILTPLTGGQKYNRTVRIGSDKNNLLLELIRDNPGIHNSRCIFFDDTQSIIDSAKELGISVVKIDRSIGFSRKSFNPLLNQINDYNKKQQNKLNRKLREKPFDVNGPNLKLEIKAKNKNTIDSDSGGGDQEENSIPQSYDQKLIKESRYKYDKKNYNTNSDKDPSEYVTKLGIEHFEDLNSNKSSYNFKIDERYVNLINIIAVIFIIIYGYIWWHKRV
jgi:hypothetical protein